MGVFDNAGESYMERVTIAEVGEVGVTCRTVYGATLSVPWTNGKPDPSPRVGETWLVERVTRQTWTLHCKLDAGAYKTCRYYMRLDARQCAKRERAVADDVAQSGVDGVIITAASDGMVMWPSPTTPSYGLKGSYDGLTELVDRLVAHDLNVMVALSWELFTDTTGSDESKRQRPYQQTIATSDDESGDVASRKSSPWGAADAYASFVSAITRMIPDKIRGFMIDGVGYDGEGADFCPDAVSNCLAKYRRDLTRAVRGDDGSDGWWASNGYWQKTRHDGFQRLYDAVSKAAGAIPVSCTVDPQCMFRTRSGTRVGTLPTGIDDTFGDIGWSMVGVPMDFRRASDTASELRELEVDCACVKRMAGSAHPLYEVRIGDVSDFDATLEVIDKYGATQVVVGSYDEWRALTDARKIEFSDAMSRYRVSHVSTTPLVGVVLSSSTRDAAQYDVDSSNAWTRGFFNVCSMLLDKLPHRLDVLFDSDLTTIDQTSGDSAVLFPTVSAMTDDAVKRVTLLIGGPVGVVFSGRAGVMVGRGDGTRRTLPFVESFGESASGSVEYDTFVTVKNMSVDVEKATWTMVRQNQGTAFCLGSRHADGMRLVVSGSGSIESVQATGFPLITNGRDSYLGVDPERDDLMLDMVSDLMLYAVGRG